MRSMRAADLLDGLNLPGWLVGVVVGIFNAVLVAHVVWGPTGDVVADSLIWFAALAACVALVRAALFRRARWNTVCEWVGVVLLVVDLVASAGVRWSAGHRDAATIALVLLAGGFVAVLLFVVVRRKRR